MGSWDYGAFDSDGALDIVDSVKSFRDVRRLFHPHLKYRDWLEEDAYYHVLGEIILADKGIGYVPDKWEFLTGGNLNLGDEQVQDVIQKLTDLIADPESCASWNDPGKKIKELQRTLSQIEEIYDPPIDGGLGRKFR